MKKNNIKTFVFSIVAVLAIIAIVGGSTYAYFQWTTADDQRTNVNVVIETGGIEMVISPSQTTFTGLRPVDLMSCHTSVAVGDAAITIKNKTGTLAVPSFKLKVKVVDKNGNGVSESVLQHIHYSVVPSSWVSGVVNQSHCEYGMELIDYSFDSTPLFNYNGTWYTYGTFSGISQNGEWSVVPKNGFLDREYYIYDDGKSNSPQGVTFEGAKRKPNEEVTLTTANFSVLVWIDSDYVATNVGNVVSDPLQDATIYVTWSEESMIQQVTG